MGEGDNHVTREFGALMHQGHFDDTCHFTVVFSVLLNLTIVFYYTWLLFFIIVMPNCILLLFYNVSSYNYFYCCNVSLWHLIASFYCMAPTDAYTTEDLVFFWRQDAAAVEINERISLPEYHIKGALWGRWKKRG